MMSWISGTKSLDLIASRSYPNRDKKRTQ